MPNPNPDLCVRGCPTGAIGSHPDILGSIVDQERAQEEARRAHDSTDSKHFPPAVIFEEEEEERGEGKLKGTNGTEDTERCAPPFIPPLLQHPPVQQLDSLWAEVPTDAQRGEQGTVGFSV